MAITAAGPAAALPRTGPWQPSAAHHTLSLLTLSSDEPPKPLSAGIDALDEPVTTLGTILASDGKLPGAYKAFLPEEVVHFYESMTADELNILAEIAAADYQTEDQALDALRARSEELYNKAVELRQLLKTRLDALNPAAKAFVDGLVETVKALYPKGGENPTAAEVRKAANEIIDKYRALPEEAKESLMANFPKLTAVVQSPSFQGLAQAFL
ncbi:hypothetical protein [Kitasatospora sp. LaBMicrA B282]|uniref:hypothetical protein n=1 Tax=Kitasatospora sp. LaBMicrA B282 TaxID=3420949 RepID=UPI003D13EC77